MDLTSWIFRLFTPFWCLALQYKDMKSWNFLFILTLNLNLILQTHLFSQLVSVAARSKIHWKVRMFIFHMNYKSLIFLKKQHPNNKKKPIKSIHLSEQPYSIYQHKKLHLFLLAYNLIKILIIFKYKLNFHSCLPS